MPAGGSAHGAIIVPGIGPESRFDGLLFLGGEGGPRRAVPSRAPLSPAAKGALAAAAARMAARRPVLKHRDGEVGTSLLPTRPAPPAHHTPAPPTLPLTMPGPTYDSLKLPSHVETVLLTGANGELLASACGALSERRPAPSPR